jgi:organic radical activating enzyme
MTHTLPVVETFHSLQGEGLHAGRSAFFIRLAGCDVGCSWCDTKVSWPVDAHPLRPVADLVTEATLAATAGAAFVVVTGGEPLQHDLTPLCRALRGGGTGATAAPLHLETSGVGRPSGRFDWITLSPKRHRPPDEALLGLCHELKVVVARADDLVFAISMAQRATELRRAGNQPNPVPPALLLQPVWADATATELAVNHVRRDPTWRLSLQTHKWLGVR